MDWFNKWLNETADNPLVQVFLFLVMFILRIEADRWQRRRAERKAHKRRGAAHG